MNPRLRNRACVIRQVANVRAPFGVSLLGRVLSGFRHLAFTLVEMLVVMAIIVIIISLAGPVLKGVLGARSVANTADAISGFLTNARIQATSQNTFVAVGFTQAAGSDDLQMAAVRSVSGTFDTTNFPGAPTAANMATYLPLGPIVHLPGIALSPYANLPKGLRDKLANGGVAPDPLSQNTSTDAATLVTPDTPVNPAGAASTMAFVRGTTRFNWYVIVFTPQGSALYFPAATATNTASNNTPFYSRLLIGLSTSRGGNAVINDNTSAVLVLDGGAGNINLYRL